jgi:(+)-trans-carveol dehydrogenase
MGLLDGKVAFISGAARGQGRSHAVTLAGEGADIICFDLCAQIGTVPYQMSDKADLQHTVHLVEQLGRHCIAAEADARDETALTDLLEQGVNALGRVDIVVGNAGIASYGGPFHLMDRSTWNDMMDVNVTGVWLTCKVAAAQMINQGSGGSIILTSSYAGLSPVTNMAHYNTSKQWWASCDRWPSSSRSIRSE